MGGCYSVIAASKMQQMQRRRTAAAILPVASSDDPGRCCSPDDRNHNAGADSKKKHKRKWRRSAPILGEADQCDQCGLGENGGTRGRSGAGGWAREKDAWGALIGFLL